MKSIKMSAILVLALGLVVCPAKVSEAASMGTAFTYQGRLIDANSTANGLYDFQFKLFNDPNVILGTQVGSTIDINELDVIDGYFTVTLDFDANVFTGEARWLEIGVRPGELEDPNAYTILSPRQEVTPTPYAIYAKTTGGDNDWMVSGDNMYSIPTGNVGIGTASPTNAKLHANAGGSGYGIYAEGGSSYSMYSKWGGSSMGAAIYAQNTGTGGDAIQAVANGSGRSAILAMGSSGIDYAVYAKANGAIWAGHFEGDVRVVDTGGNDAVVLQADGLGSAGRISMYDTDGDETVRLVAAESSTSGAELLLKDVDGTSTIELDADYAGTGGYIALRKADGTTSITLRADYSGDGRITTDELVITGGSDLSEQFDIDGAKDAVKPGMVVSIDPKRPGKLLISNEAYDNKVAGIISGAGGVKPGMMMGQKGSQADGIYPVALTGRLYCWADASTGAIQPGDLLTTSSIPGHAMKVSEHSRALGAIIGKAMTPLEKDKGLVLVLVSLQ